MSAVYRDEQASAGSVTDVPVDHLLDRIVQLNRHARRHIREQVCQLKADRQNNATLSHVKT